MKNDVFFQLVASIDAEHFRINHLFSWKAIFLYYPKMLLLGLTSVKKKTCEIFSLFLVLIVFLLYIVSVSFVVLILFFVLHHR